MCAISTLGDRAGSATVALASSSKRIVQIVELLEERGLAFSFCLTKNELLVLSGFGLLFQGFAREGAESLSRNNRKLIHSVADILSYSPSTTSQEFRRIAHTMSPLMSEEVVPTRRAPVLSRHNSDGNLNPSHEGSTPKHARNATSSFSTSKSATRSTEALSSERRTTLPVVGLSQRRTPSHTSLSSINSEPALMARSEPTLSPHFARSTLSLSPNHNRPSTSAPLQNTNLDYLPLDSTVNYSNGKSYNTGNNTTDSSDWERLLSSLDNGQTNIYDGIYGGPQVQALMTETPVPQSSDGTFVWSPDVWAIGSDGFGSSAQPAPQSVLSFSDESLTSGEEFADLSVSGSGHGSGINEGPYRGILIPEMSPLPMGAGLDGGFGL